MKAMPVAAAADRRQVLAREADAAAGRRHDAVRIMRASVDLPLPDSPMIVKISGLAVRQGEADVLDRIDPPRAEAGRPWRRCG